MTDREMFEKSFERPKNYFKLSENSQWLIDSKLGLLDWDAKGLTNEDTQRFLSHYKTE